MNEQDNQFKEEVPLHPNPMSEVKRVQLLGFESLAMPAEEGIGLHNVQSLLPELGKSRKKDQAITNIIGQPWVQNLAVEGNQLLAQNGVFNQQVSPAVGQILQGTHCK